MDDKKRCHQEQHEGLFGLLLMMGRTRDLERLYAVVGSDLSIEQPDKSIRDADEEPHYEMISQREVFGNRASLIYDRIHIRRSMILSPPVEPRATVHQRWPIRSLIVERMVGKGSYGYVFENGGRLLKFSFTMAEYVRELLTHCLLTVTEGVTPTFASEDLVQYHLLALHSMQPLTRGSLPVYATIMSEHAVPSVKLAPLDEIAIVVRSLFNSVRSLRDRFVMHLDISTSNVMWDPASASVKLIDFGGTIGDDSFLNIGPIVSRVCTRSTRPPEYGTSDTLWQRNESSETLSAYYAIMSHVFPASILSELPHLKEELCRKQVETELTERPNPVPCIRRVHLASRGHSADRPLLDWLLSSGTPEDDHAADDLGRIGTFSRYSHMRQCLGRYISQWPRGRGLDSSRESDTEWLINRSTFISLLLSRITCTDSLGITCGGLTHRLVPPPYTLVRCLALYDAIRDLVREPSADSVLSRYMSEAACYPVLVNAILYVSLAPSKTQLCDIEHYLNHPLHAILRAFVRHPPLVTIFLSPITAFILLQLESPRSVEAEHENRQPMFRCLYNLRRDRRDTEVNRRVKDFVENYMLSLLRAPLMIETENDWWKFLRTGGGSLTDPEPFYTNYVDSVTRLWFS